MLFTTQGKARPFLVQPGARPFFSQTAGTKYPEQYNLLGTLADSSEIKLATESWTYLLLGEGNGYRAAGPPLLALEADGVYLLLQENGEQIAHAEPK